MAVLGTCECGGEGRWWLRWFWARVSVEEGGRRVVVLGTCECGGGEWRFWARVSVEGGGRVAVLGTCECGGGGEDSGGSGHV